MGGGHLLLTLILTGRIYGKLTDNHKQLERIKTKAPASARALIVLSGRLDSNQRPHAPQTCTLTGLSYSPKWNYLSFCRTLIPISLRSIGTLKIYRSFLTMIFYGRAELLPAINSVLRDAKVTRNSVFKKSLKRSKWSCRVPEISRPMMWKRL